MWCAFVAALAAGRAFTGVVPDANAPMLIMAQAIAINKRFMLQGLFLMNESDIKKTEDGHVLHPNLISAARSCNAELISDEWELIFDAFRSIFEFCVTPVLQLYGNPVNSYGFELEMDGYVPVFSNLAALRYIYQINVRESHRDILIARIIFQ
jgi:hypothetical protein